MANIINNTDYAFNLAEQNEIRKGAANAGVDELYTAVHPNDGGNRTLFNFFTAEGDYLFSIDTNDGDPILWEQM